MLQSYFQQAPYYTASQVSECPQFGSCFEWDFRLPRRPWLQAILPNSFLIIGNATGRNRLRAQDGLIWDAFRQASHCAGNKEFPHFGVGFGNP